MTEAQVWKLLGSHLLADQHVVEHYLSLTPDDLLLRDLRDLLDQARLRIVHLERRLPGPRVLPPMEDPPLDLGGAESPFE